MKIEKIVLNNFKSFDKLTFDCNQNLNVLIGENNIGKTTIFDAILLWYFGYSLLITADGNSFYKKNNYNSLNINFNKLLIFRIVNTIDLFFDHKQPLSIALIVNDMGTSYELKIEFEMPTIEDSYIRIRNHQSLEDFYAFAEKCKQSGLKLRDIVSISFAKPVSFIEREELFLNKGQIARKSYLGKNYETLRNKIINTQVNRKFDYLEQKLQNILGVECSIFYKNNNRDDDEFIKLFIKLGTQKEIDISLVGSGILHIFEIFASLYVKEKNENGLNIILIDEPDSHIHADLQVKVLEELQSEQNRQIFVITHNDRLIEKTSDGELFYINQYIKDTKILKASSIDEYHLIKQGLSSLFPIIEEDRTPLIITEGKTDWKHMKAALEYFHTINKFSILNFSFFEYENDPQMGDSQLQTLLKELAKIPRENIIIGIFDCDTAIGQKYLDPSHQQLSEKVFAFAIPIPDYRSYHDGISVEFLYPDSDLKKIDSNNRRIYLSDEFSDKGRLIEDKTISILNADKIKAKISREKSIVIDSNVIDLDEHNIALTKNDFAENVLYKKQGFENMDFLGFEDIFNNIEAIIERRI
ncbi:ATP-dependent nuclease [Sulfurospirillum cavolei]|uniref:ATP-dependent nuclease n=1 Tax=Sulfurospirillum cavolei TaxID=366522 RepID=UPI0007648881|nr:AAA family ATPase [Sulfurospirillum cavolei]